MEGFLVNITSVTLSSCLLLTTPTCSSLPPDHESPSPDLSIAHCHKQRRGAFTGVLYVGRLSRPNHHTDQITPVNESRSLILGPTDEEVLAQFILTIAFSNPSDTTNTVLQGVFALASLQLHGNLKSFHYKHIVMSLVKESTNWLDEKTLLQNLMATMLLYHYEVV